MEIAMKLKINIFICLIIIFTSFAAQAEYRDPCVDKFINLHKQGTPLEGAYYFIKICALDQHADSNKIVDTSQLAKVYRNIKLINKEQAKDENIRNEVKRQVTEYIDLSRLRQKQSLDAAANYSDILTRQDRLTSLIDGVALQINLMEDKGKSITAVIEPDTSDGNPHWYSTGDKSSPYYASLKDIIVGKDGANGACMVDIDGEKCLIALQSLADWLRFQNAASGSIHAFYSNASLYEFQDYTVLREKMWFNFFEITNYPLIWESGINQQFDRFKYDIGKFGLAEPPDEQLTLVRPSIAAGFPNGHGQSPTAELVLEVVGYTTWDWKEAEAVNRWGLSVIGTLGEYKENNDTKTNPGIGLLFHTPKPGISFGLVAREYGKNGIIVTFDLINLWDERKKKVDSLIE